VPAYCGVSGPSHYWSHARPGPPRPTLLTEMLTNEKSEKSQRAFAAMLQVKKLDIAALKRAYNG
jgi:hypothetical protein